MKSSITKLTHAKKRSHHGSDSKLVSKFARGTARSYMDCRLTVKHKKEAKPLMSHKFYNTALGVIKNHYQSQNEV